MLGVIPAARAWSRESAPCWLLAMFKQTVSGSVVGILEPFVVTEVRLMPLDDGKSPFIPSVNGAASLKAVVDITLITLSPLGGWFVRWGGLAA